MAKQPIFKTVETLNHEDKRKNIPTAEFQSMLDTDQQTPKHVRYSRNTDLDPQLMWRGKDEQDWSDLVVHAPTIYIQEKVHPKALIDDLLRETKEREHNAGQTTADLFSDFNGIPKDADKTEFYQHDQHWTNRMILGDSLQVMASLAEREGLRGKVQCIYFDPPYGIKFNSNFQWSTTSRDVKDGKAEHITREPEQVKAFRDTWKDGIHSYLTYLRDRLIVARDLLTDSGSIFIQISDENEHRIRALLDEVFGDDNYCSLIPFRKRQGRTSASILPEQTYDFIIWYAKNKKQMKFRQLYVDKAMDDLELFYDDSSGDRVTLTPKQKQGLETIPVELDRIYTRIPLELQNPNPERKFDINWAGKKWEAPPKGWSATKEKLEKLANIGRLTPKGKYLLLKRFYNESRISKLISTWNDTAGEQNAEYVVQTSTLPIQRCILMTSDPGDLILDPTCGSGTSAYVSEQWGRRWITIDTSRVALAIARTRLMGAKFPYYYLADSLDGQALQSKVGQSKTSLDKCNNDVRFGFVYEKAPHITLSAITNNEEIDLITAENSQKLDDLRSTFNRLTNNNFSNFEMPKVENEEWSHEAKQKFNSWWVLVKKQEAEINQSISNHADGEPLYDKPYENKKSVRVAGPFTVEGLSPHRMLGVDENDELIDVLQNESNDFSAKQSFPQMILENLKTAGVQQAHKEDRITFSAISPWAGEGLICAEGRYLEGDIEKRAGIFIGPEFSTVQRSDLVEAARECGDAGFDVLIACAFNYESQATEFSKLGRIPVLKARMNADLHMSEDLKNTGKGNLFVIFGEPDITLLSQADGKLSVKVNGVDVFKPQTGEVISDGADGIACWFIDTDYNEESFFVRHAYFLGANDPYNSLKTTLKAEIDKEAWDTLNSDTSRPFEKPKSGRIAVKVINHLGDEVMKVFKV